MNKNLRLLKLAPLLALAGLLVITLAACTGSGSDPLVGTNWTLTAYGGTSLIPGTAINLTFEGGEVSGTAGCNHYFGSYEVRGSTITVEGVGMTEMLCTEPEGVMEQEKVYLSALSAAETFQIDAGRLVIASSEGDLTFAAQ
jgi:heat shock protein HslJ